MPVHCLTRATSMDKYNSAINGQSLWAPLFSHPIVSCNTQIYLSCSEKRLNDTKGILPHRIAVSASMACSRFWLRLILAISSRSHIPPKLLPIKKLTSLPLHCPLTFENKAIHCLALIRVFTVRLSSKMPVPRSILSLLAPRGMATSSTAFTR